MIENRFNGLAPTLGAKPRGKNATYQNNTDPFRCAIARGPGRSGVDQACAILWIISAAISEDAWADVISACSMGRSITSSWLT